MRRVSGRLRALGDQLSRFGHDTRGSLVLWFGLALIPLLFFAGVGLDYGRSVNLKQQLQNAVDSAALAGASAYTSSTNASTAKTVATTYMTNFIATMPSSSGITYTVTTSTKVSGLNASLYAVTVSASGKIANSIMALTTPTNTVAVNATATNPVYTITLTLSSFSSSAADANTLYYYIVNSDNTLPTTSQLTQFFTNNGLNLLTTYSIQMTASQKLGFELINVTGGRTGSYGSNGYGGAYKSSHQFFSHVSPPSNTQYGYTKVTRDCNLQVTTSAAAVTSGSCLSTNPAYSSLNCAEASGKTLIYSWNDMGGTSDDMDYNDMVYTVKCSQNDNSLGSGVVLTN